MIIFTALTSLLLHPACHVAADLYMGGSEGAYYRRSYGARLATCGVVARAAQAGGLDPVAAVVLAWEESNWEAAQVHPRTKVAGPLQVAARWWCPGGKAEGCDLVAAGVRAVSYYMHDHKEGRMSRILGLCHYNAGNVCIPVALRRARYIEAKILQVEARLGRLAVRAPNS